MPNKEKNISIKINIDNNLLSRNRELNDGNNKKLQSSYKPKGLPISGILNRHEYNYNIPHEVNAYYELQAQKRLDIFANPTQNPIQNINNYHMPPQSINNNNYDEEEEDIENEDIENTQAQSPPPLAQSPPPLAQSPPPNIVPIFNEDGKYIGDPKDKTYFENQYKKYLRYIETKDLPKHSREGTKPNKNSIIKYGLQQYFNEY
jgi:hypothetical protein